MPLGDAFADFLNRSQSPIMSAAPNQGPPQRNNLKATFEQTPYEPPPPPAPAPALDTSGSTMEVQRKLIENQAANPPPEGPMQFKPEHIMAALGGYRTATDRITNKLNQASSLTDLANAFAASTTRQGSFGEALNAIRAQKLKEQQTGIEAERDYFKQYLDTAKASEAARISDARLVAQGRGRTPAEPADIQEHKYFMSLTPEGKTEYLRRKRAGYDPEAVAATETAKREAAAGVKKEVAKPQSKLASKTAISVLDRLDKSALELSEHGGLSQVTGPVLGLAPTYTGVTREARNAQAIMKTINAQVFTKALQDMRNSSKTGGALGQVSDREGDILKQSLAALDQAQDTETFKQRLMELSAQLKISKENIRQAYYDDYGEYPDGETSAPPAAPKSDIDKLLEVYK